jgi:hypothetical protein
MRQKNSIFFLLGLLFIFGLFFLYLVYDKKYHVFYPKPPVLSIKIPASDSASFPGGYQFDFENINAAGIVSKENAFSGQYALKVSGKRNYSPAVQISINELLQKSTDALFGAWLFIGDSSIGLEGKLIFQIVDKSNKLKFSAASDIKERKNVNRKWFFVCGKADWKDTKIALTDQVKIYYWNNCKNTVFVDNVQVIFGKQIIKGEKSLIDNTSPQFQFVQAANQPPYPTVFFENTFAGNVKSTTIYSTDGKDALSLTNEDVFCSGRFIKTNNYCEQILVFRNNKPYALLWYETQKSQILFIKIPAEAIADFPGKNSFAAVDADGDGADELVICTGTTAQSLHIYEIMSTQPYLKSMVSEDINQLGVSGKILQIAPYQMANKRNNDIALLDDFGNLYLLKYEKNSMKSETNTVLPQSNAKGYEYKMVCGQFINSGSNDNIIVFSSKKKSGRCFYKLYGSDKTFRHFEPLVQGTFDNKCDTLPSDNSFFKCDINNDKIDELISFSNGWRYDAKLVSFNKDGYVIAANIDFTGYPKDYNPKYFEKQAMVPGNFTEAHKPAIFTFCGSEKRASISSDDMTPYIGIFSYNNKK